MLGVSAASLAPAPALVRETKDRIAHVRSRYLAIGAAGHARAEIDRGKDGNVVFVPGLPPGFLEGLIAWLFDLLSAPDGSYKVVATPLLGGGYAIDASGKAEEGVVAELHVVVRPPSASSAYRWAACGRRGVAALLPIFCDSYDSSSQPYGLAATNLDILFGPYALENGDVASNGSIGLNGGIIHGDATVGPLGLLTLGGALVTGSTAPAAEDIVLPPVAYTPPTWNDNAMLGGLLDGSGALTASAGVAIVPGGTYVLSGLRLSGAATVHATGDCVLYVSGDVGVGGTASLVVDPGASVKIYTTGDVTVGGGGMRTLTGATYVDPFTGATRTEGLPEKLEVFVGRAPGAPAPPRVEFRTSSPFYGAVYAPESEASWPLAGEVFGSVIADNVRAILGVRFHFDQALARGAAGGSGEHEVQARWWATY